MFVASMRLNNTKIKSKFNLLEMTFNLMKRE